ncbi:C40 family peptidase [Propionivibrio limicola]|uniref:C40 family peptidase n=1 Tax=Propionivibrio limicola TaxID=167645 RepID=UPI001290B8D0|nr:C40 family peptidase [Propionivibrio limicola]
MTIERLPANIKTILAALAAGVVLILPGCSSLPPSQPGTTTGTRPAATEQGREITFFALGLIDTGYRFGGKNPEAGLDCSGMVSYIYNNATGIRLGGSAADIARRGRPIARDELRPGDLVFFNTRNAPFSHVGVYIGDDRFVHAPSTNGRVRVDQLSAKYYAQRFEAARSYID